MENRHFFEQASVSHFESGGASLAVRVFGSGPALVFIHGFPVDGSTWRHVLPELSKNHTCYVLDMPGLGLSKWTAETDFHFKAQCNRVVEFIKSKKLDSCSIIAHDTGATTARLVALAEGIQVKTLVLLNTEVPNHRPPWIPFYQLTSRIPFSHFIFKACLKNSFFVRSPMGFRAFYADKELLKVPSNLSPYINAMTSSTHHLKGAFAYLRGCDLKFMDTLKDKHPNIEAKVLLIWGEKDVTFPAKYGRSMIPQFKNVLFFGIENAALMPHEEQPERVLEIIQKNC